MTTTHADFMAAIIADPAADAPRLIYADWLEEQGETARSEFIRVQVGLAACIKCNARHDNTSTIDIICEHEDGRLQARERELLDCDALRNSFAIAGLSGNVGLSDQDELAFWPNGDSRGEKEPAALGFCRRGFVAEISCSLAMWMGGPCQACNGSGVITRHVRGLDCSACGGTGRIPGIGPTLVRQQPVVKVMTEKRPRLGSRTYSWARPASILTEADTDVLPYSVWVLLPGGSCQGVLISYRTEQAAMDAASEACLVWANKEQP